MVNSLYLAQEHAPFIYAPKASTIIRSTKKTTPHFSNRFALPFLEYGIYRTVSEQKLLKSPHRIACEYITGCHVQGELRLSSRSFRFHCQMVKPIMHRRAIGQGGHEEYCVSKGMGRSWVPLVFCVITISGACDIGAVGVQVRRRYGQDVPKGHASVLPKGNLQVGEVRVHWSEYCSFK